MADKIPMIGKTPASRFWVGPEPLGLSSEIILDSLAESVSSCARRMEKQSPTRKPMKKRIFPRVGAYALCAIFALTTTALAQQSDPKDVTVEVKHHDSKDSKAVPITQEVQKWWSITMEAGYSSTYMFRGTELTPNADGIASEEIRFSGKGFTVGLWAAQQIGTAVVPHNTAVGEAGGGRPLNLIFPVPGVGVVTFDDTAIQESFRELDVYASYYHSFGCIDLTVGNIAFFIDRRQRDKFDVFVNGSLFLTQDFPSIGDETFDRVFIALSTHKIPYVVPSLTYYQTIYNEGDAPGSDIIYFDRNDELGGYLEAKLSASIPLVKDRLSLEPTALVSYSFDDRMEATNTGMIPTAVPLNGFNHFQIGTELVFRVSNHVSVIGFGNYAHQLHDATGGTEDDTFWGGGKVSISF